MKKKQMNSLPKIKLDYCLTSRNNISRNIEVHTDNDTTSITPRLTIAQSHTQKNLKQSSLSTKKIPEIGFIKEFEKYIQASIAKKKYLETKPLQNTKNDDIKYQQEIELLIKKEKNRNKPRKIKNIVRFEENMQIFKSLDTYIETKDYLQKMNILNPSRYHKRIYSQFEAITDSEKQNLIGDIGIKKELFKLIPPLKKHISNVDNSTIYTDVHEELQNLHKVHQLNTENTDTNNFFVNLEDKLISNTFNKHKSLNDDMSNLLNQHLETDFTKDGQTLPKEYAKIYRNYADFMAAMLKQISFKLLHKDRSNHSPRSISYNYLNSKTLNQHSMMDKPKEANPLISPRKSKPFLQELPATKVQANLQKKIDEKANASNLMEHNHKNSSDKIKNHIPLPEIKSKRDTQQFIQDDNTNPAILINKSFLNSIPESNFILSENNDVFNPNDDNYYLKSSPSETIEKNKTDKSNNNRKQSQNISSDILSTKIQPLENIEKSSNEKQKITKKSNKRIIKGSLIRSNNQICETLIKKIDNTKYDLVHLKKNFLNNLDQIEEDYRHSIHPIDPLESSEYEIDTTSIYTNPALGKYTKNLNKRKIGQYISSNLN